jgi:hypothetical protein
MHSIFIFNRARHPDRGYDVQGVMSALMCYKLKPDDLSDELVPTVGTKLETSGKSITTLFNMILLLKLFPEIQAEIRSGNLPASQGYLFILLLAPRYIPCCFNPEAQPGSKAV